ncbi:hypothetical protein YB2330_003913 [Saitoella coloradoensis]
MSAPPAKEAPITVAIDFGTTFSGIAFSWKGDPNNGIYTINDWPGQSTTGEKIRSVVYYDRKGNCVGWGNDNKDAMDHPKRPTSLKKGDVKAEWFKLLLADELPTWVSEEALGLFPNKTGRDIALHFFKGLYGSMETCLPKKLGPMFKRERDNIQCVITVPAIWSDSAKQRTKGVAALAGFVPNLNSNRLQLVAEPEAAALYCARQGLLDISNGEVFLVVDCGGGTVDLIAYKLDKKRPVTLSECTIGTGKCAPLCYLQDQAYVLLGGLCGSSRLNNAMEMLLEGKLVQTPMSPNMKDRVCTKVLDKFETAYKPDYDEGCPDFAVDIGNETDYPDLGIMDG